MNSKETELYVKETKKTWEPTNRTGKYKQLTVAAEQLTSQFLSTSSSFSTQLPALSLWSNWTL